MLIAPLKVERDATFPALLVQRQAGKVPSDAQLDAWRSVWEPADDAAKFDPGMGDAEKLDLLVEGFREFDGFQYLGQADTFALQGDCTSLVKTFIALADHIGVTGVKPDGHAGGNGWYISPGLHELGGRPPNMQGGGHDGAHYFNQHTWAKHSGTVYDVLFGVKGQHGREADLRSRLGGAGEQGVTHFRIAGCWYQATGPTSNTYVPSAAPEAFGGAAATVGTAATFSRLGNVQRVPMQTSGRVTEHLRISRESRAATRIGSDAGRRPHWVMEETTPMPVGSVNGGLPTPVARPPVHGPPASPRPADPHRRVQRMVGSDLEKGEVVYIIRSTQKHLHNERAEIAGKDQSPNRYIVRVIKTGQVFSARYDQLSKELTTSEPLEVDVAKLSTIDPNQLRDEALMAAAAALEVTLDSIVLGGSFAAFIHARTSGVRARVPRDLDVIVDEETMSGVVKREGTSEARRKDRVANLPTRHEFLGIPIEVHLDDRSKHRLSRNEKEGRIQTKESLIRRYLARIGLFIPHEAPGVFKESDPRKVLALLDASTQKALTERPPETQILWIKTVEDIRTLVDAGAGTLERTEETASGVRTFEQDSGRGTKDSGSSVTGTPLMGLDERIEDAAFGQEQWEDWPEENLTEEQLARIAGQLDEE